MIETTKRVEKILKTLYFCEIEDNFIRNQYHKIMESNESRLGYLNHLFRAIKRNELNDSCTKIFNENIDFLHDFMNGKYYEELTVPQKYFNDKDKCLIVPTNDELEYLFQLLEANKDVYELLYKDKKFVLELPKKSFNQKMTRVLEIHEHNLAHLVGLTETEIEIDPNKNILKKYFLSHIENTEKYGEKDSEKLWNWVLSEEGKNELRRLNYITLDFISKDKSKFPNNYDSNGVIKINSLPKFKERFKKETGLDFPIIRFSRCISKCINNLNFLNLNNISQVILDYNAPYGKHDEKDIFIVNASQKLMFKDTKYYVDSYQRVIDLIVQHISDENLKNITGKTLTKIGIDINDKDISSFLNIIETNKFLEGIDINIKTPLGKINNILNQYFDRNIHLIGFDTNFSNTTIPLNKSSVNNAHCDTSISLTIVELVSDYYKRGRLFFLDKIYDGSYSKLLRISNPSEEIFYLEQRTMTELQSTGKSQTLQKKLSTFNKNYESYKNSLDKEREDNKRK